MFKPLMIGVAALSMAAAPMAASAQSWRGGDRDRDGRYERWERRADREWRRDHRRDYRRDGPPYGRAYGYHRGRWHRGAVIPRDYRSRWYIRDYHRYGYAPPPRGYGYYRTDTGDVVLALIATGVILSLLD